MKRVVIVGGGYAGTMVARALGRDLFIPRYRKEFGYGATGKAG